MKVCIANLWFLIIPRTIEWHVNDCYVFLINDQLAMAQNNNFFPVNRSPSFTSCTLSSASFFLSPFLSPSLIMFFFSFSFNPFLSFSFVLPPSSLSQSFLPLTTFIHSFHLPSGTKLNFFLNTMHTVTKVVGGEVRTCVCKILKMDEEKDKPRVYCGLGHKSGHRGGFSIAVIWYLFILLD